MRLIIHQKTNNKSTTICLHSSSGYLKNQKSTLSTSAFDKLRTLNPASTGNKTSTQASGIKTQKRQKQAVSPSISSHWKDGDHGKAGSRPRKGIRARAERKAGKSGKEGQEMPVRENRKKTHRGVSPSVRAYACLHDTRCHSPAMIPGAGKCMPAIVKPLSRTYFKMRFRVATAASLSLS